MSKTPSSPSASSAPSSFSYSFPSSASSAPAASSSSSSSSAFPSSPAAKPLSAQHPPSLPNLEGDGSLNAVFESIPISAFHPPSCGFVIAIDSDTPVADAIRILAKYRIIAAPCRDKTAPEDAHWSKKFLGMVTYTALLDWMIEHAGDTAPRTLSDLLLVDDLFSVHTIGEVALSDPGRGFFSPFYALERETATLYGVMVALGVMKLHNVCIVEHSSGALVNIITQGRIVQFLHDNIELFNSMAEKSLSTLGLAQHKDVISISWRKNMWDALRLLRVTKKTGLPVVNSDGSIIGNVSASDIFALVNDASRLSHMTITLQEMKEFDIAPLNIAPVVCRSSDTLISVLRNIYSSGVHRIYLVDGRNRPVRVISLCDIIMRFVKAP